MSLEVEHVISATEPTQNQCNKALCVELSSLSEAGHSAAHWQLPDVNCNNILELFYNDDHPESGNWASGRSKSDLHVFWPRWLFLVHGRAACIALRECFEAERFRIDAITTKYLAKIKAKQDGAYVQSVRELVFSLPAELSALIVADLVAAINPEGFGFCNGSELPAMATDVLRLLLEKELNDQSSGYTLAGGNHALWQLHPVAKMAIVKSMPVLAKAVVAQGTHPLQSPIALGLSRAFCQQLQSLHLTIPERAPGNPTPFTNAHASMHDLEAWLPKLKILKLDVVNQPITHNGIVVRFAHSHANDAAYAQLVDLLRTLPFPNRYICFDTKHGDYTIQASATMRGRRRERRGVNAMVLSARVVESLHASPRCEMLLLHPVPVRQSPQAAAQVNAWFNVV